MILLIISHGIVQFTFFSILQITHQAGFSEIIKEHDSFKQEQVFKFAREDFDRNFVGIEWKNENEFRKDEAMFDVLKVEEKNDSIYIYCIHDEKESDLYSVLDKFLYQADENSENDETSTLNLFLSQFFSIAPCSDLSLQPPVDNNYYYSFADQLLEGEILLNTPPPQV